MADQTPPLARQMSLIPYAHDSHREVVLYDCPPLPHKLLTDQKNRRRGSSIVVYDSALRLLSVRDTSDQPVELTDCPYCQRPLRDRDISGEDGPNSHRFGPDRPFVDPEYFSMLAASQRPSPEVSGESMPSRRLHPALRSGRSREVSGSANPPTGAEFVGSEPASSSGQGISASAFSPGYFQQFFREERELGRGGNGVVLLVEHIIDGVSLGSFACKRIPVGNSRQYFEKVIIEVRLLQNIPHKHLVAYHWTWLEDHQPSKFGPSIPCLWILQDYCNGGDLHRHVLGPKESKSATEKLKRKMRRKSKGDVTPPLDIRGRSRLSFEEIFSYFRDITSGLHHLHSKGYIHRDLKPSNCLLQRDSGRTRVLISDFGEVQAAGSLRGSTGATGTISYCAPEVLQRGVDGLLGNFTTKSDIFSLGMVVFFMCFGRLPYVNADGESEENEDFDQLRHEIIRWTGFNEEARTRPDLPEKLYRFLKRLLSVNPEERPSTAEILASIKGGVSHDEGEWSFDEYKDYSVRVSSVDSPAMNNSSRKQQLPYPVRPGPASPTRNRSSNDVVPHNTIGLSREGSRALSPLKSPTRAIPMKTDVPISDSPPSIPSPRLMLPPPPERPIGDGLGRVAIHSNAERLGKVALFSLKLLSLYVPCAPYATSQWVLYPLVGLASLDLGLVTTTIRQSLALALVHVAIVLFASHRARLCQVNNKGLVWEAA